MSEKLSSDGAVWVNSSWHMHNVQEVPPPKFGLILCGNVHSGKTVISQWDDKFGFTHWSAFPVFNRNDNRIHQ